MVHFLVDHKLVKGDELRWIKNRLRFEPHKSEESFKGSILEASPSLSLKSKSPRRPPYDIR